MENKQHKGFIEDIISVYEKHNLTLSHEDGHGAFIVEDYKAHNIIWLERSLFRAVNDRAAIAEERREYGSPGVIDDVIHSYKHTGMTNEELSQWYKLPLEVVESWTAEEVKETG